MGSTLSYYYDYYNGAQSGAYVSVLGDSLYVVEIILGSLLELHELYAGIVEIRRLLMGKSMPVPPESLSERKLILVAGFLYL